ncbi:alpha/beta fold hydrolase [Micromonospora fiedleri]|uniref:Alpha/beta fold hydrolase n=1 Tax=Micromonospora fiedleri TaxID=1157498 RepID=A0ABS1UV93_9ACTN|nr:alpha/beta hydrolase [Micromonospora fiedleri]MBL6279231.1 alpha/beta fold hydrolase [Micromonospora fiedleri]
MNPTVVLVHGAYTDATCWHRVISRLRRSGHRAIGVANPLGDLSGYAAHLSSVLASIDGPIVLAGHSCGGVVATDAATEHDNVKALVYVAAIAPDKGESVPAWRLIPSWFIYSQRDPVIPVEVSRFMADRAGAQESVELPGASHALPAAQPQAVADIILRAATAV